MSVGDRIPLEMRLDQLEAWARGRGLTLSEARRRFAQWTVCQAIASSSYLAPRLAFKGGNALLFAFGSERSTTDLDFSCSLRGDDFTLQSAKTALEAALPEVSRRVGIKLRVQSAKSNPPDLLAETPTYLFKVAYAFPGERAFTRWNLLRRDLSTVVEIEIAINEVVCAADNPFSEPSLAALRVSRLDDIVAEKLRALLQQVTRNRNRPQDVLDLAVLLHRGVALDLAKVASFLTAKARARNITPSKQAFHDARIWKRAAAGYSELRQTVRGDFIEFEPARRVLLDLVDNLDLPASGPPLPERGASA